MNKKWYIMMTIILSIVLVISIFILFYVVFNPSRKEQRIQTNFNKQMVLIEEASSKLISKDEYKNMIIGESKGVSLKQLYDLKYLDIMTNPYTNKPFTDDSNIYITKKDDDLYAYHYEYRDDCRYNGKLCLRDVITDNLRGKSQKYQNGLYYKGTNDKLKNNFLWFSGEEYRIMGINSDGSIKLVSSLPVVSISWGSVGTADYANSYARKWLNILPEKASLKDTYEGLFYKSINRSDFVLDYNYCVGKQDPTNSIDTTCDTKLLDKVGLLTWWEYKIASSNNDGIDSYLNIKDRLLFNTADIRNASNILTTDYTGSLFDANKENTYLSNSLDSPYTVGGIRPIINLKATVSILKGTGTVDNPYRLVGDEEATNKDKLASRYAGEYLSIGDNRYRIVSKDANNNIKIVSDDRVKSTGTTKGDVYTYFDLGQNKNAICSDKWPYANCSNIFDIKDGSGQYAGDLGYNIGYFLDSEIASNSFYNTLDKYKSYLVEDKYYLGKWDIGRDYKSVYTNASSNGYGIISLKVGMLHYGEMLAGNNIKSSSNAYNYWLISPYDNSIDTTYVSVSGNIVHNFPTVDNVGIRPVINLKSSIEIISGSGTKLNPYKISN